MMHKCLKTAGLNDWSHKEDPCYCECSYCDELRRIQNLPAVTEAEIKTLYEVFATALTGGPWKTVQLPGFGPNNYIVTDHPNEQWYKIVAQLEHAGNVDGMRALAWCRDGVPRLLNTIRELQDRIQEMQDNARDEAWERDIRD